jgi:hypothetical protein
MLNGLRRMIAVVSFAPRRAVAAGFPSSLLITAIQEVFMNWTQGLTKRSLTLLAVLALGACAGTGGGPMSVPMSGAQEVPAVNTSGTGTGSITVGADGAVNASIKTTGLTSAIAAHIHEGAAGANGPVIVPMKKQGDSEWVTDAGAKFTPSQFEAYKAGRTYFNVHTPANKGGEIRGQIRPAGGY